MAQLHDIDIDDDDDDDDARGGRVVLRVALNNFKQLGFHFNFSVWFIKNSECCLNSKR